MQRRALRFATACVLTIALGAPPPTARALAHDAPRTTAAQAASAAVLSGVWGTERIAGPAITGPVTIVRSGSSWEARAAGFAALGLPADGMTAFRFAGDRGELRADLAHGRAYWIQPASASGNGAYASPVRLTASGTDSWRGTIAPLPERVDVYLAFARGADGTLRAFVRDPNHNAGLRLAFERVELDGARVRLFTAKAEYDGSLDAAREHLTIALPPWPGTLDLTRRDALHARGFYPRPPPSSRVAAETPAETGDGWRVAPLEAVGMRRAPVEALLNAVLATPAADARAPYLQSVAIARHGKLVVDEYFYGFAADRPHDVRSAGKTLADALVGIAAYGGAPLGETTPVAPFYRAYRPFANDDPRKARITLGDLLTMSPGFACDDDDDASPGQEDHVQETARDWYRATLDLPLVYDPGSRAVYCSQGMNLVGGVVSGAAHAWLPDFFETRFARPLDFGPYYIPMMPTGTMYLGGGEYVRPRDFLKLGQLFLDGGVWDGRRLLSAEWVRRSLAAHASLNAPNDYGLAWHIYRFTAGGKTYVAQEAGGNGGQMLFVIPDLDLVAMITAGNYGDYRTWSAFADLIPRYVIPAAS